MSSTSAPRRLDAYDQRDEPSSDDAKLRPPQPHAPCRDGDRRDRCDRFGLLESEYATLVSLLAHARANRLWEATLAVLKQLNVDLRSASHSDLDHPL